MKNNKEDKKYIKLSHEAQITAGDNMKHKSILVVGLFHGL